VGVEGEPLKRKPPKLAKIEADILEEFRRGGITEAHIQANGHHVHGICEGQKIVINPAPSVVDTLIHELLHRRYPRWGEKRVWKTAERIVYYMHSMEIRTWYRRYKRIKRNSSETIRLED
jgi:hypothetical protein